MILTLTPAYGRDYPNSTAAQQAWADGADFQIANIGPDCGRYTSVRDLPALRAEGYRWLNIRFKSLTHVAVVKLSP
jgi:hypothetical protein